MPLIHPRESSGGLWINSQELLALEDKEQKARGAIFFRADPTGADGSGREVLFFCESGDCGKTRVGGIKSRKAPPSPERDGVALWVLHQPCFFCRVWDESEKCAVVLSEPLRDPRVSRNQKQARKGTLKPEIAESQAWVKEETRKI